MLFSIVCFIAYFQYQLELLYLFYNQINDSMVSLLKIIGILGIIGSLITGLSWNDSMGGHGEYVIPCALAGVINCIICFALATCVKAAKLYLTKHDPYTAEKEVDPDSLSIEDATRIYQEQTSKP